MLNTVFDFETNNNKPWVIVGAGPVGSMMAALLITLFPEQEIHVFDKYYTNVRGHGLDIHAQTITEMKVILIDAEEKTKDIINKPGLSEERKQYFATILKRINDLMKYLDIHVSGQFIRTFKISEVMQNFCKERNNNNLVRFHLKSEITADDLNVLTDDSLYPVNEKQAILKQADIIFGADGSHSGVRKVIFNETSDDLRKDVLTHLLEIKLEMTDKPNTIYDKLTRSILPTIKSGKLHIWNQSIDGTATLHVFISETVYDQLHIKDENGSYKGSFANPYRRLIDLPDNLKDEIERIVVDIIDENKMHASTFKVTVIPMHVYKARQLIKMVGDKRVILVGDSGVGLVLARSANNGFYATSAYAAALYNESLEKEFNHNNIPDFTAYQIFWEEQHQKLQDLLSYIDTQYPIHRDVNAIADRQIQILDEYERQYKILLKDKTGYSKINKSVDQIKNDFYSFVRSHSSYSDQKIMELVNAVFANLKDEQYLLSHPITELHQCQNKLIERANLKIQEAKFEVKMLKVVNKVYETSSWVSSSSSSASLFDEEKPFKLSDPEMSGIREELQELRAVISRYDLTARPEYENFVFLIDRLYLAIERDMKKITLDHLISPYRKSIAEVTKFLTDLPVLGTEASDALLRCCPFNDELVARVTDLGNYLFNQARKIENFNNNDIFISGIEATQNYPEYRKHDASWYERQTWLYDVEEAKTYAKHLNEENDPVTRFVLLYSLFKYTNLDHLKAVVYKQLLSTEKLPTALNIQVLCEVLQNKILESAQTKELKIFDNVAYNICKAIENDKARANKELNHLNLILVQLGNVKKLDDEEVVAIAIKHLLGKKTSGKLDSFKSTSSSFSFSSSSSYSSSIFSDTPKIPSACMDILKDNNRDNSIKLSIIYVLLNNNENKSLQNSLVNGFGKALNSFQVTEIIESKLKRKISEEQLPGFSAAMYKLTQAVNNNKSELGSELKVLNELFSLRQCQNEMIKHYH